MAETLTAPAKSFSKSWGGSAAAISAAWLVAGCPVPDSISDMIQYYQQEQGITKMGEAIAQANRALTHINLDLLDGHGLTEKPCTRLIKARAQFTESAQTVTTLTYALQARAVNEPERETKLSTTLREIRAVEHNFSQYHPVLEACTSRFDVKAP